MKLQTNDDENSERIVKLTIFIIVGVGIVITSILVVVLFQDGFTFWKGTTDYATTSHVGAFIGGILGALFTFLNAYLLYITLNTQSKFNKYTAQNYIKEDFISRYYELLHIHNEIVNQLRIGTDEGRQVFKTLFDEFRLIFECIEKYLSEINNWKPDSLPEGSDDRRIYEFVNSIDIKDNNYEKFKIVYSYGYFFYGCKNFSMCEGVEEPEELLNQRMAHYVKVKLDGKIPEDGRNYLLGHYFRQMYMSVRYIDNSELLSYSEKYVCIKMLRSQLSDYEQILLYYNSLSPMGHVWQKTLGKTELKQMSLICKYRMIKNVPHFFYYVGISPSLYFKTEKDALAKQNIKLFEQTPGFDEDAKLSGYNGFCFMIASRKINR